MPLHDCKTWNIGMIYFKAKDLIMGREVSDTQMFAFFSTDIPIFSILLPIFQYLTPLFHYTTSCNVAHAHQLNIQSKSCAFSPDIFERSIFPIAFLNKIKEIFLTQIYFPSVFTYFHIVSYFYWPHKIYMKWNKIIWPRYLKIKVLKTRNQFLKYVNISCSIHNCSFDFCVLMQGFEAVFV